LSFNYGRFEGEEPETRKNATMKIKFTKPGNTRQTTIEFASRSEMTNRRDELASDPKLGEPAEQAELAAIQAQLDEWDRQSKQAEADAARREQQREQKRLSDNAQQVQWLTETKSAFSALLNADTALTSAENRARKEIGQRWFTVQQELEDRALRLMQDPFGYFEWASHDMKLAAERQLLGQVAYSLLSEKRSDSILERLKYQREEITKSVLNNRWRGSSTSEAHNAAHHIMNEVSCSWVDRSYSILGELIRELEKPAASDK
jgi:hypothetical protein